MTVFNLGSCNIDHVYRVTEFVRPGETLPSASYQVHPGGKGLNQSVAIARAGSQARHIGKVGSDGTWLRTYLEDSKVDTTLLQVVDSHTGHAIIQVNDQGDNAIILYSGTNQEITQDQVESALSTARQGDILLLQNETSQIATAMNVGHERGLRVMFNAAPMTSDVSALPLELLDVLIINELEGEALSGKDAPDAIISDLAARYPDTDIVLTLGSRGACYRGRDGEFRVDAQSVSVTDSTGAGDTFTGYLVAGLDQQLSMQAAMSLASRAAAVSVTRQGAASSIPLLAEVQA